MTTEQSGFEFLWRGEFSALYHAQFDWGGGAVTPIKWVTGAYIPGLKRPACEADYPFTSGAKVMNAGSYRTTSTYIQWRLL